MREVITVATLALALVASAAARTVQPYKIGDAGVKAPVLVKNVTPQYTKDARARHVQGTVELLAVVKTDGSVAGVRVTKSLDEQLDRQAIAALKQWTFKPGTKDGTPVDVEVNVQMSFRIK